MTGRTISHYEILEKLGAGGMGEIYKARDPRLNRSVAVKALPASASGDPERRRRFVQEAQAASGLNHPNIITIHDILSDEAGSDYMVMEFVEGRTLGEVIPLGGLGLAKTLQYATQIADALAAAHAAGIVHRDLKPANVMITDSGRVKVLDFGLAKITVETSLTEATRTIATGPVTVEGSILGTVSYMSPEQAQGKRVDARSDIFAFGAVLFEMVTGQKAFPGDSPLITLAAILRDEVKPISDFVAGVPPELEEVIGRALRKDPAQRWQSMQEVHGVLAALRQRYESGILQATQILPPPAKKRPIPWALAMGLFGVTVGIGGWWVQWHREQPANPQPVSQQQTTARPSEELHSSTPGPVMEQPPPAAPRTEERPAAVPAKLPSRDDGTLNNESVLSMVKARVADAVIVSQIHAAGKTRFDLSTPEVIRLTRAGVSPTVLEAMRPPSANAPPSQAVPAAPLPAHTAAPAQPVPPIQPGQTRTVAVLSGLPVLLTLVANIPNDPEPGTPLKFVVKQDFTVGGATVLAAGAAVTGEVAGIKKGILGLSGKPTFRLISADAVDGSKIALRAAPGKSGEKAERVIEPPGRRDKTLLAPAGTEYLGYIDGAQQIKLNR